MIGNYRINLGAGIVGFIITFFVAYSSNVLMVCPCIRFTLGIGIAAEPSGRGKWIWL